MLLVKSEGAADCFRTDKAQTVSVLDSFKNDPS